MLVDAVVIATFMFCVASLEQSGFIPPSVHREKSLTRRIDICQKEFHLRRWQGVPDPVLVYFHFK